VFEVLHEHFGVDMECFASPLNAYFPRYCSAFDDTDKPFGSVGSFFDFKPDEGSYEANPPFVPEVIAAMAEHMEKLLGATKNPLSFVIIVPCWKDKLGWGHLNSGRYLRKHLQLSQKDHGFTEGSQHSRDTRYRIATFDTSVFWWQNKAGAKKWPATHLALEAVRKAFRSKHLTNAEKRMASGEAVARSLYFGAVPSELKKSQLRSLCEPFGTLESVSVDKTKQCAFVNFDDADAAVEAFDDLQGRVASEIGPDCYVKFGKSRLLQAGRKVKLEQPVRERSKIDTKEANVASPVDIFSGKKRKIFKGTEQHQRPKQGKKAKLK